MIKTFLILLLPFMVIANPPVHMEPGDDLIGAGKMPALCLDRQNNVHLVYGVGDSLLYRISYDKGKSFNQPELVAIVPGLHAAAMRGPQITANKYGLCVVATASSGTIYSFIRAGQKNWIKGAKVTDRDSVALEGFVALAGNDKGSLFAAWLDLRTNHRNKIFGARSDDGGKTWSANVLVYKSPDSTVCECCKPSVAMSGGKVYVMFRNWLKGNRDLYLIKSEDGGITFGKAVKLGVGSWALNGCPMDGGGLTIDHQNNPQTVWNRNGTIYSCAPGKPEQPLGSGRNCTMTQVNGRNVYCWTEKGNVVVMTSPKVKKDLGAGHAAVIMAIGDADILCVWEKDDQMIHQIVRL